LSTYLVTGGFGFIGSHLVDTLIEQGHQVAVVDDLSTGRRENVVGDITWFQGSITDRDLMAKAMAGVDGCFHLAAIASVARSNEDWSGTSAINLGGTVAVFEAAALRIGGPVPVVYASSAAVYGDAERFPLTETSPTRPLTAYGADKLACELHARIGGAVHRLPSFGLRPFNVYGPRQDPLSPYSGVISIFARRALQGEDLLLFDGGRQERDFVYVADVVRFFVAAMAAVQVSAPVANICGGRTTLIADLATTIVRLANSRSVLRPAPPRPGDILISRGDPALAQRLLGVNAVTSLDDGLGKLLDFLR
jgi:UDP-glucose 4-epimerase